MPALFTEADDLSGLQEQLGDVVRCPFEEGYARKIIGLHFALF